MPELADVVLQVASLDRLLTGKTIRDVRSMILNHEQVAQVRKADLC